MERENENLARRLAVRIGLLVVATAVYGAVLATWRSPLMAAYVAVKLPAVFVGATLVVSVFCWMAGLLAGADLRYGEVLDFVFSAMAIAGAILLALAPVVFFFIVSGAPDVGSAEEMRFAHACLLLVHIAVFAAAGVVGNVSLGRALKARVPHGCRLGLLMVLWLASFAVVGCQLGWMARPLVGSPNIKVEFVRADALESNFLESLFKQIIPHIIRKGAVS